MSYSDPWEAFGEKNRPSVECDFYGSLAADVCEDFGLTCATPNIGGALEDIDIKHMDAMTVIRMSLMQEGAERGTFYEPIVNAQGEIEFKQIGSGSPHLDKYYTIQTHTYKEECKGVMITGKKPMAERLDIVWQDLFEAAGGKKIWDTTDMTSNCNQDDFRHSSIITYHDPHLSTSYNDGIDNLYEITNENPYDRILGYAYKIIPPDSIQNRDDVSISMDNSCEVPFRLNVHSYGLFQGKDIPDIGELIKRPITPESLDCWVDRGLEIPGGIEIEVPEELRFETTRGVRMDKLLGINTVYVIGMKCNTCMGIPKNDTSAADGNTEDNTDLWISIDEPEAKTYKLDAGVHYIVNYEGTDVTNKEIKLVFANNARFNDNAKYGSNVDFQVLPACKLHRQWHITEGRATILPTGGTTGILVHEIWAVLSVDSPCLKIVDPQGDADIIAAEIKVEIAPLVMRDLPAPIAKDGNVIDLTDGIVDHDPTTTQNLENTELERAISEMDGGPGLTMTLSFIDEDGAARLSGILFDYMNQGDGAETTYVCGPDSRVELGDRGDAGGVVNSISYSYSDQGSYTISVSEGPYIVGGVEGVTGAPYFKQTESMSSEGVIIQDAGNHVDYKVRVDEFGDVYALNCTPNVLRVGDRVSVSLHNNPVED